MSRQRFVIFAAILLSASAGFARAEPPYAQYTPPPAATSVVLRPGSELPPPNSRDVASSDRPYLIGPFDKLVIDVYGIEELSQKEVQTDAGGRISFPLAGVIEAAGHTPGELEQIISDRLRGRFVRDPQVTVNLKETVSQVVTVDGEVREPGNYPVIGRMTLMRVIATAKGTTEFARLGKVVIFRTVDGQKMAGFYDLKAIRRGEYGDPEVFANDVVIVDDSWGKHFAKDFVQVAPLLSTPLILIFK